MKRSTELTREPRSLARRAFLRSLAGSALAVGAGPILSGCGGSSHSSSTQTDTTRVFSQDAVRISLQDGSASPVRLGRGFVKAPGGQLQEVGFQLYDGAIEALPPTDYNIPNVFRADVPAAPGSMFVQIGLSQWSGHDPHGIGEVPPGFIDGRDVPTAVVPGVGNGFEDPQFPHMLPHWYGLTYNLFYYNGHLNGIGSGATDDFLATTQSQSMPILQPSIYPKPGLYPHKLSIVHDDALRSHLIVMSDFQTGTPTL